jgi:DinB superfamily
MSDQTIADIYAANDRVREKFKRTLAGLTENELSALPDGEKWTVSQIVEHVSMVENGIMRICAKLLQKAKAEGQLSDGTVKFSEAFGTRSAEIATMKLEAPEFVHPTGERTVADSLASMDETLRSLAELRPLFEEFDADAHKFPHPFFGDLSAVEWLALCGGHEARHLKQINSLAEKMG